MRAFVALPLPEAALAELERLQEGVGQGRLVPSNHLHVTLVFLDDQPVTVLEALHVELSALDIPAFDLSLSSVEAKGGRKVSLVWAGVEASDILNQLHARVRSAAHQAGIALPRKRYRPHVTLARFGRATSVSQDKLAAWLAQNGTFRAGPFPVDRFCLYQSTLMPDGPVYDEMAAYRLS